MSASTGGINSATRLEKGISELQGLHELLITGDVEPRILSDFRDALNRVRNTAWAAQQYVTRKENDQESSSVLSFLAGERIRAAFHLCGAIGDDLKRTRTHFLREKHKVPVSVAKSKERSESDKNHER